MSQGFTRGVPIDTDPNLALDSDLVVPSQKAVKDYVDTGLNTKQDTITLTTAGTSGAATLIGATLNIPQYSGGSSSPLTTKGDLYTFSTVDARLGIGANATMLMADSAATTGNKWVALSGDATIAGTGVVTIKTSVALAGSPTTTTQPAIDNSTKIATTAFVATAVAAPQTGSNLYLFYNY
jgi:hypothetical protein